MNDEGAWFTTMRQRTVYEGFATVRIDTVVAPDGQTIEREIVEHADAVAIVPITSRGEVVLLKQYRQPLGSYLLEVPAGKIDVEGESPEATAQRELREECRREAGELRWLTTFYNSAGWATERTFVYLATDLREAWPDEDYVPGAEEADMEVVTLPFQVALEQTRAGTLTDGKTVVGLLMAQEHLR